MVGTWFLNDIEIVGNVLPKNYSVLVTKSFISFPLDSGTTALLVVPYRRR